MNVINLDHQQLYARERRILGEWRVLPLVTEAESTGLGPTVRDWMPSRWGEWHLAEVWLELPGSAGNASNETNAAPQSSLPSRVAAHGAKP
ncbi:MAG: hypothetical protein WA765_02080 [Candidatus Acidiferrum sp.]